MTELPPLVADRSGGPWQKRHPTPRDHQDARYNLDRVPGASAIVVPSRQEIVVPSRQEIDRLARQINESTGLSWFWAFMFGPIYFVAHGLWRAALIFAIYLFIVAAFGSMVTMLVGLAIGPGGMFATMLVGIGIGMLDSAAPPAYAAHG